MHRNLSIDDQAMEVDKVKRSESGMIVDPMTLPPTALLAEAEALMSAYRISGVPVTDGDGRLVGILTNRDLRFERDLTRPLGDVMTRGRARDRGPSERPSSRRRKSSAGTGSRSCRSSTTTAGSAG